MKVPGSSGISNVCHPLLPPVPVAAEVTLVAELARADATVEQLLAMRPGDFIELDREPLIRASIGGVPVFECQYGTHNDKYAIRVERSLRGGESGWMGEKHGN